MSTNETFKQIPGYFNYEASNLGNIRRIGNSNNLKPQKLYTGYLQVSLSEDGEIFRSKIHKLVATVFLKEDDRRDCVNHIDGDKTNNKLENLERVTRRENSSHHRLGTDKTSKYVGVTKLKEGSRPWKAQITINKRKIGLGYFSTEEEAAKVYQAKVAELNEPQLYKVKSQSIFTRIKNMFY